MLPLWTPLYGDLFETALCFLDIPPEADLLDHVLASSMFNFLRGCQTIPQGSPWGGLMEMIL